MKSLHKVTFRNNAYAGEFISHQLKNGKTLSKLLLKEFNFQKGIKYTYLPPDITEDSAKNFSVGGKFGGSDEVGSKLRGKNGDSWTLVPIHSTKNKVLEIVQTYLKIDDKRLVIIEDALARASDAFLLKKQTKYILYNDEVYHYIVPGIELSLIKATLRRLSFNPPSVCCLTSMNESNMFTAKDFSINDLKNIRDQTEKVIVSAYDDEGFIVWEK